MLVEGARILDVARGRYLAPASVYIESGRIKSVTPEPPASLPGGTIRVQAAGSVLVPGLIDVACLGGAHLRTSMPTTST